MKRTEIAMIVLIASLSMMLTFTLVRSLLGDKIERSASVEQAVEISDQIEQPAKRVFNNKAINPTVEVCVQTGGVSVDEDATESKTNDCESSGATTETESDSSSDENDVESANETQSNSVDSDSTETNDNQ